MYTPSPEEIESIRKDIETLETESDRAMKSFEQMYDMHVACPAITALMDSMLSALTVSYPATFIADKLMTGGNLSRDVRHMIAVAYLTGVNTIKYPTMIPCTEDVEGHMHEVDAFLNDIASQMGKEDGDEG